MANFNFNKVILGGRMTADPELKTTQSGIAVTRFSIAVNRRFAKQGEQAQVDFINCVAWRQQAEFVTRYFRKGSSICVMGSIQTSTTTDAQGQKRYFTDVVVDEVIEDTTKKGSTSTLKRGKILIKRKHPLRKGQSSSTKGEDTQGKPDTKTEELPPQSRVASDKVKSLVKVGVLKKGMNPHQNLKILKVGMLKEVMLKEGKE